MTDESTRFDGVGNGDPEYDRALQRLADQMGCTPESIDVSPLGDDLRRMLARERAKTKRAGRDAAGRFTEGNPGGPGRPRRRVEEDYLQRLAEVCSLDTWADICARAVADAKDGDAAARQWLARYLLGEKATLWGACAQWERDVYLAEKMA